MLAHSTGAAEAPAAAAPAASAAEREFPFSDVDFRSLAQVAYERAGIVLSESKRNLVYSRLSRRLRVLGLSSFRDYRIHLAKNDDEMERFINAISTNLTKFFRESHHFDHFGRAVAAPFGRAPAHGRLRAWSAGCSTGEEPYTIAMLLRRAVADIERRDARVLATDIDTDVVAKAAAGRYQAAALDDVPREYRSFFVPAGGDGRDAAVAVDEDVGALITFRPLNLLGPWPFKGLFDAIFCRNVMIYFDTPTKARLVERLTEQVKPGGFLYIGHSESLIGSHAGLKPVGRTIYQRTG